MFTHESDTVRGLERLLKVSGGHIHWKSK